MELESFYNFAKNCEDENAMIDFLVAFLVASLFCAYPVKEILSQQLLNPFMNQSKTGSEAYSNLFE